MSNRFQDILQQWFPQKDACQWVLATIIETKGSAYRKAGAKMMINSFGKSFGLLSGGCLEADLMRQAQKCWLTGNNHFVCYDMQDESDIAWQLGIGCGGMVRVLLQPIDEENNYLQLIDVYQRLEQNQTSYYSQTLLSDTPINQLAGDLTLADELYRTKNACANTQAFVSVIKPRPKLVIFGGGSDALPLVNMAKELGWYTTLIDSRTNYARPAYFKNADVIIKQPYEQLLDNGFIHQADSIIVMNHNLTLDAQALTASAASQCQFIGLLGPNHRTERVFELTTLEDRSLAGRLLNPVGLDLGGELPESIALAILAQAHAFIEKGTTISIMEKLKRINNV
ncbi:MAG: XdhC family protein [Thalassotalea sp.]